LANITVQPKMHY